MKARIGFFWLLIALLVFSSQTIFASGDDLQTAILSGQASEGGHDEGESDHAEEDDHHNEKEDDHESEEMQHDEEEPAHVEAEDHDNDVTEHEAGSEHAEEGTSHADDGHHNQSFTWASLIPLFTGIGVATIASGTSWGLFMKELTETKLAVISLTIITGILHLMLGLAGDRLLLLNGIGYLGLLALLYLPIGITDRLKNVIRVALIGYTLVTIAGYFWLHSPAQYDALAISSKIVEAALIVVLAFRIAQVQNEIV